MNPFTISIALSFGVVYKALDPSQLQFNFERALHNLTKMGFASGSVSSRVATLLVLGLVLNLGVVCNGGKTSSFVRKVEKTVDMPLDSDVFKAPHGYNAPQQV